MARMITNREASAMHGRPLLAVRRKSDECCNDDGHDRAASRLDAGT